MAENQRLIDHSAHRSIRKKKSAQTFYTPFAGLDQHLTTDSRNISQPSEPPEPNAREEETPDDEERLFREAMSGVSPLREDRAGRVPWASPLPRAPRFLAEEDAQVQSGLLDLVNGFGPFEISYSDEYVDGAVMGLAPGILRKLKKGEFSYREYIDLHGLNRHEAREKVIRFVQSCFFRHVRCVLIVSGRGLNSEGREPVLKQELVKWLTRAPLKRLVLAFASARPYDGGPGAFYVLLRKNQAKAVFVTPAGSGE